MKRGVGLGSNGARWDQMDVWESVVRMTSALGVVLAIMVGLLALLRSRMGRRFLATDGSRLVRVLGSGHIAPRKQIVVVAVAGEVLIVGTTPTEMVALGRVSDPAQIAAMMEIDDAGASGFLGRLAPSGNEAKHAG